jgi:ubiquinone/menaquinone biosynthesis C-methylase UbiE
MNFFSGLRARAAARIRKRMGIRTGQGRVLTSQEYWTGYNVTDHRRFASGEESLAYFDWRSAQYYDYLALMPVAGFSGQTVLDYGCGPGHDLVGFAVHSPQARLIGVDVSPTSLDQARQRLALHGAAAELHHIDERDEQLPLETASIDYIHCSGVLHHVPDPVRVLQELRRVLRPGGRMRLMIYNYDSVWLHLFAAYLYGLKHPDAAGLSLPDAFRRITDSPDCPISHAWTPADVAGMARAAGFSATHLGNAVSVRELAILPQRFEAILDPELKAEHRNFLLGLTFNDRGMPCHNGQVAGLDGCYGLVADQAVVAE